jgi:hypothetical protein
MNEAAARKEAGRERGPSLGELTIAITLALGVISAWLYLTGLTYISNYLGHFHIPMLMVDMPKEQILVYGGIVVWHFPLWDLAAAALLTAATAAWVRLRINPSRLRMPLGMAALLAVFWLGRLAGAAAADDQFIYQHDNDYPDYQSVEVWPKDTSTPAEGSPWASPDLASGCYRFILYSQNRLFLLRTVKGTLAADPAVVSLPWEEVAAIKILPGHKSRCQ